MSIDPFIMLGIEKGASQSDILEAYKAKRKFFTSQLFDEGEVGANAARKLEQLDSAYQMAMEFCHENASISGDNTNFDAVKQAIRDKNSERAQQLLDSMSYRGGEWHYFQSIVFYEKNWLSESKKQLEIAIELDPSNAKYAKALENIKKKIDGAKPFANTNSDQNSNNQNGANQSYQQRSYQQQQGGTASDGCCAACQVLWCADCCCECMGGDCIRCC